MTKPKRIEEPTMFESPAPTGANADSASSGSQTTAPASQKPKPKSKPAALGVVEYRVGDVAVRQEGNETLALLQTVERLATNKDANPTVIEMLLKEMRSLRAEHARAAFDAALAKVQPLLPVIDRKGRIEVRAKDAKGERTGKVVQSTSYALWEDVVEEITPVLGEHGFSLQFKTGLTEKGLVRVLGILAGHGHREQSEIELQHDSTGSKNSVQAVMSSVSYGKRHVAAALLNFVSRGEDNDGADGKALTVGDPLSAEQRTQVVELATAVGCPGAHLLKHMNDTRPNGHPVAEEIDDLPAARFEKAIEALRSFVANKKVREAAAKKGSA